MLSVVIPVHNEEAALLPLYDRLTAVLEKVGRPYEVIFVDDASTDRSFELLANLVETDPRLRVVRLRRNFGQTAALSAGFDEARGDVIISMDGDLQHAPEDLPALLEKIDEGYDIASGWRKQRNDARWKVLGSRLFNAAASLLSGARFRDIQEMTRALAALGVEFEKQNPVTSLMSDPAQGLIREDILDEKVLSAIVEVKTGLEQVPTVLRTVRQVSRRLATVVAVGVSTRCDADGQDRLRAILEAEGYPTYRGKTNLGLGRVIVAAGGGR